MSLSLRKIMECLKNSCDLFGLGSSRKKSKKMYQRISLRTCFIFILLIIDDVVSLSNPNNRHSGLYIDNGQDQTIIHRLTTKQEKLALEHEILKLLGFPAKPKTISDKGPLLKRSAPKFLLNIYKNALAKPTQGKQNKSDERAEFDLSRQELLTIDQSDVIITFAAQQSHQGAGGKPDRVKRIWFDVSAISEDEQMTSAELRLYRGSEAKNLKNRGAFTITVYRVTRTKDGVRKMEFVDSANSTAGQHGWITLNVTESLRHWMTNIGDNKGLYLSVNPIDRSDHEIRPEDIGIVGFKGDFERQPFMAGFFKSSGLKQMRVGQTSLNSLDLESKRNIRSDASNVGDLLRNHYRMQNEKPIKSCGIRTLYVSFKDLQWQDWIIAPEGYDAYFCNGECKFPLNKHMNATNHAIMQTLVHLLQPHTVPKPCCTPTQLYSISVLYFLDENNVILKKFRDMVVRGCGCH